MSGLTSTVETVTALVDRQAVVPAWMEIAIERATGAPYDRRSFAPVLVTRQLGPLGMTFVVGIEAAPAAEGGR